MPDPAESEVGGMISQVLSHGSGRGNILILCGKYSLKNCGVLQKLRSILRNFTKTLHSFVLVLKQILGDCHDLEVFKAQNSSRNVAAHRNPPKKGCVRELCNFFHTCPLGIWPAEFCKKKV